MFRGRGRGRRGRGMIRTYTTSKNFVTPAQLRTVTEGRVLRGSFDPPRVISNPWNTLVLSAAGSEDSAGITAFTVNSFATLLRSQIGLPTTLVLFMRILRISIWSTAADVVSSPLNFALQPAHLQSGATNAFHQWIEDIGTPTRPAHCHFLWPRNEADFVFNSSENSSVVVAQFDHSAAFGYYIHVHVLWRPQGGDPIPSRFVRGLVESFERVNI